ncbi:hypothetical protein LZ32DRAFT_690015 [Colletotrichum eremochloae]|nr:hypothetical protein LZ32DRAFT_690015 [Colletotrichum eremochloae]
MHIDECKQWLRTINGCTHIGVRSVQVFHSYKANLQRVTAWLVDNTDKNGKILDDSTCEEDTVWYPERSLIFPPAPGLNQTMSSTTNSEVGAATVQRRLHGFPRTGAAIEFVMSTGLPNTNREEI